MRPVVDKSNILKRAIESLISHPKRIFLIDSIGALLSAVFLVAIVLFFRQAVGLPEKILYLQLGIACIYSVYSMCCYFLVSSRWRTFLRIISIANLLYSLLIVLCLVVSYDSIAFFGLIYFSLEIMVILCLVFVEFMILIRSSHHSCLSQ